jgi:triacylglycerol esterase/lipase EstA (alpha/beta hydrolase family)
VSPLLFNNGFCVFALNYGRAFDSPYAGGQRPIEEGAHTLRDFVGRVLSATGTDKVDLVGHSEGTLMPRYWMNFLGGHDKVDHYVMLAPIWKGSQTYGSSKLLELEQRQAPGAYSSMLSVLGSTAGAPAVQYSEGSPFMKRLNGAGTALPGVTYTNIGTRYDELVTPYTNGFIEGKRVTNITVQDHCAADFSEHGSLAVDPVAMQYMLNGLDPVHANRVPCVPSLAAFGAVGPTPHVGLRD